MYEIKDLVGDYPPDDADDDTIREWLKTTPSKNYEKHCGLCGGLVNMKYWFCKKCSEQHGLLGVAYKDWPEVYKVLVRSLRREEYANQKEDENTEAYTNFETGDETTRVQSQAYSSWMTKRCSNDLNLDEILLKYGVTKLEFDILTTDNLKQLAEHIGMNYNTAKTKRRRLKIKLAR